MLRVGTVPYLVARPLDLGLEDEQGIELVREVPARLVQGLRAGELDVALVSAVELFRCPGYGYLDGWAVAGRGTVSSVQVFLRRPIAQVRRVALDPASRASAALLRVVWPHALPEFVEVAPGDDPRALDADAWLRIGDRALVETYEPGALPAFNPCARWVETTGLCFAFAVWIVRPGALVEPWIDAFARARDRGRAQVPELALDAAKRLGVPGDAARRYFADEIDYEPGSAALARTLALFHRRAAALGLAEAAFTPVPIASDTRRGRGVRA